MQQNGQRRYGPPPTWDGPPPPRGSEVFVGKIPKDCFEDELVPVFEQVGTIYEIRLMIDNLSKLNRGYAFVVFRTSSEAKECVKRLNNYEIRPGRTLSVCMSVNNCRLFIGGIPKKVSRSPFLHVLIVSNNDVRELALWCVLSRFISVTYHHLIHHLGMSIYSDRAVLYTCLPKLALDFVVTFVPLQSSLRLFCLQLPSNQNFNRQIALQEAS